jgi:hypothetical protein
MTLLGEELFWVNALVRRAISANHSIDDKQCLIGNRNGYGLQHAQVN